MVAVSEKYKDKIYKLLETASPEEVYQMVLDGNLPRFPRYFWSMPENYTWARICTKYMIENVLKWSRAEVCSKISTKIFKEKKLSGMLSIYDYSIITAIIDAYPDEYRPWEFSKVPQGFWQDDNNKIAAIKWLIEDKLKWTRDQVCENLSYATFEDNNLAGLMSTISNNSQPGSPYYLINLAYPGEYKPWEFGKVPQGFWQDDSNKIAAVKWLIEDKLKWTRDQVCENLSVTIFEDSLCGLMTTISNNSQPGSPYYLINLAYPGEYKPWEFNCVPVNYWNRETGIEAIKWLIEDKLKWDEVQVCKNLGMQTFINHGLRGLIELVYGKSIMKALESAYPGVYRMHGNVLKLK